MESITELKQNSIELKKNAKGEYAWDIKLYFSDDSKNTIKTLDEINKELKELYG